MSGITMTGALVRTYEPDKSAVFPPPGGCGRLPRCGGHVTESKSFSCETGPAASFSGKTTAFCRQEKELTRKIAAALLKDGRAELPGCHSEKTGKTYDAVVVLDDTGGQYVGFKLEFSDKKG